MRQCDWCGTDIQTNEPNSDSYVITIDHKIFCKIHTPGQEPFKDCLADYAEIGGKMYKKKSKKNKSAYSHKKSQRSRKRKVIKKFDAFLFELNQKARRKRNEA